MDIYSYIKKDHRAVAELMQRVVTSRDPNTRMALFEKIHSELVLHLKSEEQTFYAAIEAASKAKAVEEQMEYADHEHDEVREYLDKLSQLDVADEAWIETFGEFKHAVSHHVEEEEGEVWEKAKKYLSADEARKLAREMDDAKTALKSRLEFPDMAACGPARKTAQRPAKV